MKPQEGAVPEDSPERRIEELGDQFLDDLREGRNPSLLSLVRNHPQLAPQLQERLKLLETVYRAGKILAQKNRASTSTVLDTLAATPDDSPTASSVTANESYSWRSLHYSTLGQILCPECAAAHQLVDLELPEVKCLECGHQVDVREHARLVDETTQQPVSIGRFEVQRLLGQGAFGLVYLARDPKLKREVALKVPRQGYFLSREDERRFFREAQSAANLHHRGIVRIHEISAANDTPYLVSEYVDGLTLSELIDQGEVDFRRAVEIMVQICDAVQHAHEEGVIHRDLKPGNILLDRELNPAVTDFGLARRDDVEMTVTLDGTVLGTPAYMAPEQAAGHRDLVDAQSDIYSLGVILYKMLCQELPFSGGKRMMIYQVIHEDPVAPTQLNALIPKELETITLKAMAKSKGERFSTAAEMRDELNRWLQGRTIETRAPGRLQRIWRWSKKHPAEAILVATIAGILLAATLVFWDKARTEARLRIIKEQGLQQTKQTLKEVCDQNGFAALDDNRLLLSAYWFGRSLELDSNPNANLRCGMILDRLPKLKGMYPVQGRVQTMLHSKSGKRLAVGMQSGDTLVFDTETGDQLLKVSNQGIPVFHLAFLNNDQYIACQFDQNTLDVHDIDQNQRVEQIVHASPMSSVVVDDLGQNLITTSDSDGVQFWNVADGVTAESVSFENEVVSTAHLNPQSDRLVIESIETKLPSFRLRILDAKTHDVIYQRFSQVPLTCQLSPDGTQLLLLVNSLEFQIVNLNDGEEIGHMHRLDRKINEAFFAEDGASIVLRVDENQFQVRRISDGAHVENKTLRLSFAPRRTLVSHNRKLMALESREQRVGYFYSMNQGIEIGSRIENLATYTRMSFHPNDRRIAVEHNDGWIREWDLAGGMPNYVELKHGSQPVRKVQRIDALNRCVTISEDEDAKIWDLQTGDLFEVLSHQDSVIDCDVSPSGKWIATASYDQKVRFWDCQTGQSAGRSLELGQVPTRVKFSPDGRHLIAACEDGKTQVWLLDTHGEKISAKPVIQASHAGLVTGISFSPNGERIATCCMKGEVKVWDLQTSLVESKVIQLDVPIEDCCFTKVANQLVLTGFRRVEIWDLSSRKRTQSLGCDSDVLKVLYSRANGQDWIVATDLSEGVSIWQKQGQEYQPFRAFRSKYLSEIVDTKVAGDHQFAISVGRGAQERGVVVVWDPVRGVLMGPPMNYVRRVSSISGLSHDQPILSTSEDGTARIFPIRSNPVSSDNFLEWAELCLGERTDVTSQADGEGDLRNRFRYLSGAHPELSEVREAEIEIWLRRLHDRR